MVGPNEKPNKKRTKIRLSKLLSFSRKPAQDDGSRIGKPGFSRVVYCNEPWRLHELHPDIKYPVNFISTTKYKWYTFLPKSLFEQFRRVANLYFLLCAVLSLTPLTPYLPASLIFPLVLVVGVSMTKESIEDWRRWIADQEVNNRKILCHVGEGVFEYKEWKKVEVGDILKVEKDNFFPADMLLLSSSYPDGVCYVETMNLDGETNLKLRKCLESTLNLDEDREIGDFKASIQCEDPNPSLYTFVGNLTLGSDTVAIGPNQILLRDSKLRNTGFVYGAVIFTGHETKVMKNSSPAPSKRSRVERRMDKIIYLLFSALLFMSLVGSIAFGFIVSGDYKKWWYLVPEDKDAYYNPDNAALSGFYQGITGLILYGYLIPISLYVSIEIVKVFQAMFIGADLHMYHFESDTPARARTSNLNEELGQVDTILSDKTGTLTCNQMEFLKCSIAGVAYGRGITEVEKATAKRLGKALSELEDYDPSVEEGGGSLGTKIKGFALRDDRLMNDNWMQQPNAPTIQKFLRVLAVCHTVIPEEDKDGPGGLKYEAESPDEASFVIAAQQMGFEFVKRTQTSVHVREPESLHSARRVDRAYEVLNLLEFNSTRKRMSVIVKDEEKRIWLMCKGADSIIYERLSISEGREFAEETKAHLKRYGEAGLRTLALTVKEIEPERYADWSKRFLEARTSLSSDREAQMDSVAEEMERDLVLVGASAVEDKLQDGVPDAIDRLAQAGIKLWVLTGDKMETAINIGFACSLLRDGMRQIMISLDIPQVQAAEDSGDREEFKRVCTEHVRKQLMDGASLIDSLIHRFQEKVKGGDGGVAMQNGENGDGEEEDEEFLDEEAPVFALIVDGKSLLFLMEKEFRPLLLSLAMQCASVICCRVSPKQKAQITAMVKDGTGRLTLGIGDGANDVGMIQESDIGVGISGVEGQQAVMASDFAIAQFRFLERLLLVHGHWCYKRIAAMVVYFFYKNVVFGLTIFYYNAFTAFSGQILFNSWYTSVYNVFFTSLPVILMGILEKDVPQRLCLKFPALYQQGPKNLHFGWNRILGYLLYGVYSSIVSFVLVFAAFGPVSFDSNGFLPEWSLIGITLYTVVVWLVNIQIALMLYYFTWITFFFLVLSVALWYIFMVVFGFLDVSFSGTGYKAFTEGLANNPLYWLISILVPVVGILPYLVLKTMQHRFSPMDHQILNEIDRAVASGKSELALDEIVKREQEKSVSVLGLPVGFSATVEAVTKRMRRKERRNRRRRGEK